ncbi:acyl carrier protein [Burkholderiaceae bacterium DAT-1]|nr:acyl carrier protein [Burkholderiaceae bacterium DAT-1]
MNRQQLLEVIRDTFPDASFNSDDSALGLGSFSQWDSLGNFNLLLQIEEAAGIRLSSEEISETKTLAGIIACLKRHGAYAD